MKRLLCIVQYMLGNTKQFRRCIHHITSHSKKIIKFKSIFIRVSLCIRQTQRCVLFLSQEIGKECCPSFQVEGTTLQVDPIAFQVEEVNLQVDRMALQVVQNRDLSEPSNLKKGILCKEQE